MSLKNIEAFNLYTVEQVAELFPKADARKAPAHVKEVEHLIRAHACFRQFGDQILLTQSDVRALLRALSRNNRVTDGKHALSTDGYVLAVGSRTDPECQVFIGWAPVGELDDLLCAVQRYADFKCEMLDYVPRTYGEFEALRERLKPCRYFGNWYTRGPQSLETQRVMDELFATHGEDEDE